MSYCFSLLLISRLVLVNRDVHRSNAKDKIALMEAKLRQMESSSSSLSPSSSAHPSLPPKPPATSIAQSQTYFPQKQASSSNLAARNTKQPLPSLPLLPMSAQTLASSLAASYNPSSSKTVATPTPSPSPKSTASTTARPKTDSRSSMLGIKIVRKDH